ncbi:striatin-like isoform X1 [Conger conger]|uniref:striatin-like isoform X1 n=1 Tax=Conger conger TaxID=82655 RepID=UPI002A59A0BC|nr:striatin-like isoform X1 [Conger conger]
MDEQAGPGVFFNNNNNSVLPGGGKGPLHEGDGGEVARSQYSIPGILHFLQHEWARFEVERAQWDVEKAELQAQIAFLQGERRGQENLKQDLVRRIKMLEYALKQDRAKHHKLKYGTELKQGDMKPPSYDSDDVNVNENEREGEGPQNHQLSWKHGRQLLRQYLQEVGYTDTILDVKSQRVRTLLGLAGTAGDPEPMVNGTEPVPKACDTVGKPELTDSDSVLEAFKFIESAAAEFSDEDEDEDGEGRDRCLTDTIKRKPSSSPAATAPPPSVAPETSDDPDAEEALRGFDFLSGDDDGNGSPNRSSGDGTDWEKDEQGPGPGAWDVDQGMITKLKEQYRKERKGKKGVKRPNRSKLQDMLCTLRDAEDLSPLQPPMTPPSRPTPVWTSELDPGRPDDVEALTFAPSAGTPFALGGAGEEEDEGEMGLGEMGLGELAGLTVANEADSLAYDVSSPADGLQKSWSPRFTLRSHFDAVRGLAFHPLQPVLVTASEDRTLKMWNLHKTVPAKKSTALDVEPVYTFRAHRGAVLCVVMSASGEQCFSGGVDGSIQSWNVPSPDIDPYDSYESSVLRGALCGHSDAVWSLVYSAPHQRLLSCSADGTVRLWDASNTEPALAIFNEDQELGTPSSVAMVSSDPAHMVTSFSSGRTGLFNMETRQLILSMESAAESGSLCQINKVLSHPTLPITITAQEDRHINFFDNNTGKLIHSMVAHLDAVTSLAVDPNGLYLMSGSHDCSVRLWSLETKTCIQEFSAHRKKLDESIHDVAFHPTKAYIASAGADALAKVFV